MPPLEPRLALRLQASLSVPANTSRLPAASIGSAGCAAHAARRRHGLVAAVARRATSTTSAASTPTQASHTTSHKQHQHSRHPWHPRPQTAGLLAAALAGALVLGAFPRAADAETPPVRTIRWAEVREHGRDAAEKWIVRGDRVYDITEWIPNHPGGEVILRGVGGVVDPFWRIFTIHNRQDVLDVLEQYFIGVVDARDLVDGAVPAGAIDDPFANDPERDARLLLHTERPCNAETPASALETFITPNHLFYVRNHLWAPDTPAEEHTLTVELLDGTEKTYSMADLGKFPRHSVTAVLQCSGNRRQHMTQESYRTNGLQWGVGAIGNAVWTGVKLRDVLADAGLDVADPGDVRHAQFIGAEAYGASIPIDTAVDARGDVLLATHMNGEPLPRDHGYPLRVLVPGTVAARSVKWLRRIALADEESPSQWQRRDYKCFGPNEGQRPDWDRAAAIQEMPVQSAITSVRAVDCWGQGPLDAQDRKLLEVYGLEEDCVRVEGYAWSGGGRPIVRVDVSADGGATWGQAELLDEEKEAAGSCSSSGKAWAWQRWSYAVSQRAAGRWLVVKAVDAAYNTQPSDYVSAYNFRGNLTTAWHRVEWRRGGGGAGGAGAPGASSAGGMPGSAGPAGPPRPRDRDGRA